MKRIIKTVIIGMVMTLSAVFSQSAFAQDMDFGLDNTDYLPDNITGELEENGITPDEIQNGAISVESVLGYIINLISDAAAGPLKLMASIFAIVLLCSVANVFADNISGKIETVFGLVSALAGAGLIITSVSGVINTASEVIKAGSVFLAGFIPAFAGIMSVSGHITSAAALNAVIMGAAQLFSQLSANFLMPLTTCVLGVTLAGTVNSDLKLSAFAASAQKIIIWCLGLLMTLFVALLGVQSFISVPADSITLKAAKFTVSSGVPFVGGTVSDALSVMRGGISMIRSNFGAFGIIAGAVMILPSIISAACYKLTLSISSAFSDIFGLSALASLIKSAESAVSVILAMLVCFLLMIVISVSLMIFIGLGGAV